MEPRAHSRLIAQSPQLTAQSSQLKAHSCLMPLVIGIDPGTVSIDICGLDDGRLVLDRTLPTAAALADPAAFIAMLEEAGPVDLIAGPSGYGLPLIAASDVTEEMLRLAYLAASGEPGGIGGLRALARALASSSLPVV